MTNSKKTTPKRRAQLSAQGSNGASISRLPMTGVEAQKLVTEMYPDLGPGGFGEAPGRGNLIDPIQIEVGMEGFLRFEKGKGTRGYFCSYGLKHVFEMWGRENGGASYISNGAAIVAGIALGLPIGREDGKNLEFFTVDPDEVRYGDEMRLNLLLRRLSSPDYPTG